MFMDDVLSFTYGWVKPGVTFDWSLTKSHPLCRVVSAFCSAVSTHCLWCLTGLWVCVHSAEPLHHQVACIQSGASGAVRWSAAESWSMARNRGSDAMIRLLLMTGQSFEPLQGIKSSASGQKLLAASTKHCTNCRSVLSGGIATINALSAAARDLIII